MCSWKMQLQTKTKKVALLKYKTSSFLWDRPHLFETAPPMPTQQARNSEPMLV